MPKKPQQLAKLSRPRLYDALPRERLFKLLDEKRKHPAVWIAGPPGAGKTTLVASYLEATRLPCVWYQVDSGDADPATFFYYLGVAATASRRGKSKALPLFTREYLSDLEGFSRRYFRDLYSRLSVDFILVFDNYQEIHDQGHFDRIIVEALGQVPNGINIVLISRSDPPPAFARCISAETLTVVGWPELQLTLEEATAIAASKVALDPSLIKRVYEQCSGWAAGLTLILERSRRLGVSPDAVEWDSRDDVFAYFASQIFDQAPRRTQTTLMRMALLPFATAPLAIAISGDPEAGKLLEDLYRRHLFTERRGRDDPRYQFHALFREFLIERLRSLNTESEQQELARGAGRLLKEGGLIEDAVILYCEGGDWEAVAGIILGHAKALLAQGRWKTLQNWIVNLPAERISADPWLLYWHGLAKMQVELSHSRATLIEAFEVFASQLHVVGQILCAAAVINTIAYEYDDFSRMDRWIDEIDRLLDIQTTFPERGDELFLWSSLLLAARYRRPAHSLMPACLSRIEQLIESETDVNQKTSAAIALLNYCNVAADLDRALPLIRRITSLIESHDLSALNQAYWWLTLGFHHHLNAKGPACLEALDRADRIAAGHGLVRAQVMSGIFRVYCLTAVRDTDAAEAVIETVAPLVDHARPMDMASLHLARYTIGFLRSNAGTASHYARLGMAAALQTGSHSHSVIWRLLGASGLALAGETEEAERWLDDAWEHCAGTYLEVYRPAILLARASCALRNGDRDRCHALLREGLERARGTNASLFFRWTIGPVEALLAEALNAGIEVTYVQDLIGKFGFRPPDPNLESWPWPVRIITLGDFSIHRDGKPIKFSHKAPRKPLALLKAIVALGAIGVPEKKILDALWPDEDGDAAMEAFRVAIHRLRKMLGEADVLEITDGLVSLNLTRCWLDAIAFENAVRTTGLPENGEEATDTDRVLRLYRGHFLPGEEEAPWALSRRERLRAKFIGYVARIGKRVEEAGRYDLAADYYCRGIEADDLAEEFYQGLMRCHIQAGRNSEGMSVYRRLRQTLSVTLGIAPSASSERLFQSMQQ